MAKAGADFEEQRGILDNLARKYSATSESIVADMERASDGLVARADLMQIALGGIAKGLKPEQLTNLADAARILGDAAGKDATTALNDLTQALETGKTKALKGYLGTTIDLEAAFGDLYTKMTETEKAQALYNITMTEAIKLQSQQTVAVDDAGDKLERLEAKWKNVKTAAATFMKTMVVGAVDAMKWLVTDQQTEIDVGLKYSNPSEDPFEAFAKAAQDQGKYDAANAALKKRLAAREADKKSVTEMAKIEENAFKKEMELLEERDKEEAAYFANLKKEAAEAAKEKSKDIIESYEHEKKAADDYYAKLGKASEKSSLERLKIERDLYSDLRGYEKNYYDSAKKLLEDQEAAYRKEGVSEVAIEAWKTEELYKLDIKRLKAADSITDGIRAYMKESAHDVLRWGQASYEVVKSLASSARNTLGNVFFDGIKGDMKSFSDYWQSFTDAILRTFTNVVAQMVVEWTTAQFAMSRLSINLGLSSGLAAGVLGGAGSAAASSSAALGAVGGAYAAWGLGSGAGAAGSMTLNGTVYGSAEELFAASATGSGWMGTLATAAPWVAGALLADQVLFGGEGLSTVTDVIGDIIGGIGDIFGFGEGGRVGEETGSRYRLPALAFANAPHAAAGLRLPDGGIPVVAHPGERILNPVETRAYESGGKPITVNLVLDGKILTSYLFSQTRSGLKVIHERGITNR